MEKYGHQPRLYALAREVSVGLAFDDDVLFAAAWLHDVGVFTGHRPEDPDALAKWDNVVYAVDRAPGLLASFEFPAEKIAAVVECIRTHQPGAEPTSVEGTILRDADILEQLGAIAVLRTVCKVGRDTRFWTFTDAVRSLERSLAELPGKLRLETSRALALEKVRVLRMFLEAVHAEAGADLA